MCDAAQDNPERVIDVREIKPHIRHTIIFQLFEHLDRGSALQLISDHDPKPLRFQLDGPHGDAPQQAKLT